MSEMITGWFVAPHLLNQLCYIQGFAGGHSELLQRVECGERLEVPDLNLGSVAYSEFLVVT